MSLKDLVDIIKIPTKYFVVIFFISCVLLFAPESFINYLGMQEFIDKYRMYFGIILIVSFFIIGVNLITIISNWISKKYRVIQSKKMRKDRLKNLTEEEKQILKYYIKNRTRTQELEFNDGIVSELERVQIIYRASTVSLGGVLFSYNIQPWAWEYLNKESSKKLLE